VPDLVDITPHVSLLAKSGQSGHSVAEAVAELVDNSIDARVGKRTLHVDVSYDVRAKLIEVEDDGSGMARDSLARALVLALSAKGGDKIGRFGLGMKTACASLGNRFTITSARAEDFYEAIAEYDEESFIQNGEWKLPIRRRKKMREHGTLISIESDRVYHGLAQSLIRNLGWTFRHFIADGVLELRVNGERVDPPQHQVDTDSILPLAGAVAGQEVRGWAGLLVVSSQRGWYGFDLIRHRRVIRRHEKLGFQAHPQTARVVGELHLDGFETNNLKTDFIRETDVWRELEVWLSETIEPVIAVSRSLAHAGAFDRRLRDLIQQEREAILAALGDDALDPILEFKGLSRGSGRSSDAVSLVIGPFHVEHVYVEEPDAPFMRRDRVTRPGEADLIRVETNLGFANLGSDLVSWACHNVAEAVAIELATADDYIETKSKVWMAIASQNGLATALRRSAKARRQLPATSPA
jgi:Histidine kinase-, DNA gyrase B-, and HSP90-like ATPase